MTCTCGADLAHAAEYARQRRQVFEVPEPTMVVTEHQIVALSCGCGQVTLADAPVGVSGRVQYGPTVKAAAVYARGAHFLPFGRAARLLGDLCGAQVSTGFVHTVFTDAARRLGPFLAWLRDLLRAQPVLHADETPARVDGGFKYVHVACTDAYTLFHVGGRSAADIDAGGVLAGFTGTIVRDGYAAYQHLTDAEHAWCGAHLLRDLKGVHETDPGGQSWAEAMANTLLIAKNATESAVEQGRDALSEEDIRFISSAYAGAIAHGRAENPPDRNADLSKAGKLVERFATHRDTILRFVIDLAVPFTNNSAERALRPVKLQQKTSGTWRQFQVEVAALAHDAPLVAGPTRASRAGGAVVWGGPVQSPPPRILEVLGALPQRRGVVHPEDEVDPPRPPVEVRGQAEVGVSAQAHPRRVRADQVDGLVDPPGGVLIAGRVAGPVDQVQHLPSVGQ